MHLSLQFQDPDEAHFTTGKHNSMFRLGMNPVANGFGRFAGDLFPILRMNSFKNRTRVKRVFHRRYSPDTAKLFRIRNAILDEIPLVVPDVRQSLSLFKPRVTLL